MLKSKEIRDYFEVNLSKVKPNHPISFDVYLYFSQSRHLILWRKRGEILHLAFLENYKARGISKVWVHQEDEKNFKDYLGSLSPVSAPANTLALPPVNACRSIQGEKICSILNSADLPPRQKQALVAKESRDILQRTVAADDFGAQTLVNLEARQIVEDVLEKSVNDADSVMSELWKMAKTDPDLEHSMNVATFTTLFAMAFGRIDRELLSDMALAGLLHDIGLSQISAEITSLPWSLFSASQKEIYSWHIENGLELLKLYGTGIPERVKSLISQHHEKFDGTGYPKKLQGLNIDGIGQLLAIADLLESVASGRMDGKERTLKDSLDFLGGLEKDRTFPQYFNPEIFAAVLRWTRNPASKEAYSEAAKLVRDKTLELVPLRQESG